MNHQGTWSLSSEQQKQLNFLLDGWSATGLLWLLVVDREVEEWDLRGTGVSTRRSPVRLSISIAMGTSDCQVTGQRDLDLKPYLSVLRRHEDDSRSKRNCYCVWTWRTKDLSSSTSHPFVLDTLDLIDAAHMCNQNLVDLWNLDRKKYRCL